MRITIQLPETQVQTAVTYNNEKEIPFHYTVSITYFKIFGF